MKNLLLCVLVLLPLSVQARPYHLTSVHWIVATRNKITYDDRYVTIVGHVTRRMGDEEYWFTDGTGSVRLDSENFDLPVGPRLMIGGRIDQAYLGFGHLEVDVRNWHYAPLHRAPHPTPAPAPAATSIASPAAPAAPPPAAPAMTPALAPATQPAPTLAPPAETGSAAPSGPITTPPAPTSTAPAPAAPTGTNAAP